MGRRQGVIVGLRVGLVALAAAAPLLVTSAASAVVSPPQFNCVPSQATTFSNHNPVAIPDAVGLTPGQATSTINVAGLTGKVYDIDVTTKIPHTAPVDLHITLTSPGGKIIDLSVFNGFEAVTGHAVNAFDGTVWDDSANPGGLSTASTNDGLVTDHKFVSGTVATPLVPQEALAAFAGDRPNGVWTLTVLDAVEVDTGTIDNWSLSIATDASGGGASGAVTSTSAGPLTILNANTVNSTVQVPAATPPVQSISVDFTTFDYAGLQDLTLTLRSPAGTVVTLTSANGGPTSPTGPRRWAIPGGIFTGFGFPDPITEINFGAPTLPLSFAPEESFGAFVGEDPSGTWTLSATDAGGIPDAGTIGSWSIHVSRAFCGGSTQTTLTGPAAGFRIGAPIVFEATSKSTGPGFVHDLGITLAVSSHVRVNEVDSGAGGSCSWPTAKRGGTTIQCNWPGRTAPGTTRTARIVGEAFVVYPVGAHAEQSAGPFSVGQQIIPMALSGPVDYGPVVPLPSDVRAFNGERCSVLGSAGPDDFRIPPGNGHQVYCGRGGNDRIFGTLVNDVIDGGPGADLLKGSDGSDQIDGGPGADTIYGGKGSDRLRGGSGPDRLFGEQGRDRLIGGPGRDRLFGGLGIDFGILGASDTLVGIERMHR